MTGYARPALTGPDLARVLPSGFASYASKGRWKSAKHLTYLGLRLRDAYDRKITRLIIQEPPRHGKSSLVSQYLPPWWLGGSPNDRVALGSYHERFAATWGRKSRDVFKEHAPGLWGHRIRRDLSASNEWGLLGYEGGMRTAGVGGAMTGYGANLLIVDDPVKDAKDANSATVRDNVWDWWQSTAYTRLEPGGVAIIVMTRWHEDDLVGRILKDMRDGGEAWEVISMPAIAEVDEHWQYGGWEWKRAKGEALWPARYPIERLLKIKQAIGSYWFGALFQQRPQPLGGGIFKQEWFRYATKERGAYVLKTAAGEKRVPIDLVTTFTTTDLAISQQSNADYVVCCHWALTRENELILLDIVRDRIPGPEQVGLLVSLQDRWGPSFQGVESVAYQALVVQMAQNRGLPVTELVTGGRDKVTRALTLAARMESEHVFFMAGIDNLDDFTHELLHFPNAEHDDCVDAGSYAAEYVVSQAVDGFRIRSL